MAIKVLTTKQMPETIDEGHRPTSRWDVATTGKWSTDNAIGKHHAYAVLHEMAATGFTPLFGSIVQEMVAQGRFDGASVGFLQVFSELATAQFEELNTVN